MSPPPAFASPVQFAVERLSPFARSPPGCEVPQDVLQVNGCREGDLLWNAMQRSGETARRRRRTEWQVQHSPPSPEAHAYRPWVDSNPYRSEARITASYQGYSGPSAFAALGIGIDYQGGVNSVPFPVVPPAPPHQVPQFTQVASSSRKVSPRGADRGRSNVRIPSREPQPGVSRPPISGPMPMMPQNQYRVAFDLDEGLTPKSSAGERTRGHRLLSRRGAEGDVRPSFNRFDDATIIAQQDDRIQRWIVQVPLGQAPAYHQPFGQPSSPIFY
ncbi:hypothetical protein FRB99_008708 [Tulasnella sp. 403]|nr:hypothetical protein FRB99_008708 [Tulasnella sp. 403]